MTGAATVPPPLARDNRGQASVPRHIGLIEPWIGGSLAAYTAWLYAVAYREAPLLWGYVAGAVILALWSWRQPARMQMHLMVRAVLFALLGFLMFTESGVNFATDGPNLFFWISVPMLFYAFLLRATLAWWLLGLNFAASTGALIFAGGGMPMGPAAACAGFLLLFAAAAIRMGTVLRRTDELLETRRVDAASGMLNEYGFVDYGGDFWRECRKAGMPATLVFLDVADLARLRQLYGASTSRQAMEKVVHLMQTLATGKHLVGRLTPSRFALLMPGATREQAMYFLGDKLGRPPQIELDDDDLELILLVNIHAAESQLQNVSFSRFFAAEHELLDFYFSDQRDHATGNMEAAPPAPPAAAISNSPAISRKPAPPLAASTTQPPVTSDPAAPSTLQMPPHD